MALADSTITVDVHDTLPDVLNRIQMHPGRAVRLRVPTGSAVLLTANEFRVLKDAADRDRVRLTLESPDRLRLQLARMFSLPAAFPDPAVVTPIRPDVSASPPRQRDAHPHRPESTRALPERTHAAAQSPPIAARIQPPITEQRPLPPIEPREQSRTTAPGKMPNPDWPGDKSSSPVSAGKGSQAPATSVRIPGEPKDVTTDSSLADGTSRPDSKPPSGQTAAELVGGDVPKEVLLLAASDAIPERRAKPRRITPPPVSAGTNHHQVGAIDVDDLRDDETHWTIPEPKHRVGRRAVIGAGAAAIVVLALIVGAVLALPGVTIAVTLKQQPVQGDLTYRIVNGQTANAPVNGGGLVFPATPFAFDVTVTKQVPTTGTRLIPQQTANGLVTFANPTKQAVKLAKGTRLTAETGIPFALTDDVTVPAADAKTGRSGFATGKVRAVDPGSSGNLETGVLGGHLDVGVYYSNREGPTTGGTDKKMPAVSATDLKQLQSQVAQSLPQTARNAVDSKLPNGQSFVESSLALGQPTFNFDHKEGDQASQLSLTASVHVSGLSYDQAAAMQQVKQTFEQQLASGVPAGYSLDSNSLQLSQPAETSHDVNGSQFKITAKGHAQASFTASDRSHLADQLSGKSADQAAQILAANPALVNAKINYSPSWLPKRMPRLANRIDIRVGN